MTVTTVTTATLRHTPLLRHSLPGSGGVTQTSRCDGRDGRSEKAPLPGTVNKEGTTPYRQAQGLREAPIRVTKEAA
jgi:hypothetical protein